MCMLHFKTDGCDYCTPKDMDFKFNHEEEFIQVSPKKGIEHNSNYEGLNYTTELRLHVSFFENEGDERPCIDWQFVIEYEHQWTQELKVELSGAVNSAHTIEVPACANDELWIPVKYCPWCGRDLEKTVVVQDNGEKVEVAPWIPALATSCEVKESEVNTL